MDNVVQYINIENIIPRNFKPSIEEKRKIEGLVKSIKQFGILDPILVKPKNGKYEIILGMDKYQAALIANLNMVPVIVKEEADETYSNIDVETSNSLNFSTKETFSKVEKNSDIINLSELSKINLEYERDDVEMNNGQFNNDMTNNNFGQPSMGANQAPTFGGRFFPSLEDEPTNMNMMGGATLQPNTPIMQPINNNDFNNNLIDLTDLSTEKDNNPISINDFCTPNFNAPTMNIPPIEPSLNPLPPQNNNFVAPNFIDNSIPQNNNFDVPNFIDNPLPQNDNIINLESLQNNNPAVKPMSEPVSMDILNADFGAPQPTINQFNPQPIIDLNTNQASTFNNQPNQIQSEFGLNKPLPSIENIQPMSNLDINPNFEMAQPNFGNPSPAMNIEPNIKPSKDITPATNIIKNIANNLEALGYKININEEDLPTSLKLIIEIEK